MTISTVKLGKVSVSRMIIGGNPFSGFSHQGSPRDCEMQHWYTVARIKKALFGAQRLGITAHLSRSDHHVIRYLMEYWVEGGTMTWLAQTCPELGSIERGVQNAIRGGAKAVHIHGGVMDWCVANRKTKEIAPAIKMIREAGLAAGIAGHNPKVFQWAVRNIDVDYYMCSYYNSAHRDKRAEHVSGMTEWFLEEDRRIMCELVQTLPRPVIHYKVMAAGRNDPRAAMDYVARSLRDGDAVCIGIHTKDHPRGMAQNIRLLQKAMAKLGKKA
jgi:hypothetical protein